MATLDDLREHLKFTAEIYGKNLSTAAAILFAQDLARYKPDEVIAALAKCRMELRTFPSVADIISRIDDGRPGVEEAWSHIPKDERTSITWTDEMAEAYGAAREMIAAGDMIGARMAFKEVYSRRVAEARLAGRAPRWTPSLGHEPTGREPALLDSVERGRIGQDHAQALLPGTTTDGPTPEKVLTEIRKIIKTIQGDDNGSGNA
jgi:hypothetical protein